MTRCVYGVLIAVACAALLLGGCGKREAPSAVFVLEEFETASAVKDPGERVERLKIFVASHADHPYRFLAYARAIETMTDDMKDETKAWAYLSSLLAKEKDPGARGELFLDKFSYILGKRKDWALAFADTLLGSEKSPRLFLYMGYYLMDSKGAPDVAVKCFMRSAELATNGYDKAQAFAMAGMCLQGQGKKDEAMRYLQIASGNPQADRILGSLLWEQGKQEEALQAYIRCAAFMPGARKDIGLDSLYQIVYPGVKDLDDKIMAQRIEDEGRMPAARFVDLEGREYDLSRMKGVKLVINVMSPT